MEITSELLAAYAAGNVSPAERLAVRQYLKEHPDRLQTVLIGMDDDYEIRPGQAASGFGGEKAVEGGVSASVAARFSGVPRVYACMMPDEASRPEDESDDWKQILFGRSAAPARKKRMAKRVSAAKCSGQESYEVFGSCASSAVRGDAGDRDQLPAPDAFGDVADKKDRGGFWNSVAARFDLFGRRRGTVSSVEADCAYDMSESFGDVWLPGAAEKPVAEGGGGPGDAYGADGMGDTGSMGDTDITDDAGDADSPRRLERRLDELLDSMDWTQTRQRILPMTAMAAEDQQNNLCAIRCEGIALRHFGFEVDDEDLIEESRVEGWLRAEGTALHHIGKLAGRRGLNVAHRYDCSTDDILRALEKNQVVIAVVDGGELFGDPEWESMEDAIIGEIPDHAVVVTALDNDSITILDPFTSQEVDTYPLPQFLDAWADSSRNLVLIGDGDDYEPHPIDLSGVGIPEDLQDLCEALAENAHEIWARDRMREGWTYGPVRDESQRRDPDLLPYNRLSDSKRRYGREQMMNLLRLLGKLGWDPVKR